MGTKRMLEDADVGLVEDDGVPDDDDVLLDDVDVVSADPVELVVPLFDVVPAGPPVAVVVGIPPPNMPPVNALAPPPPRRTCSMLPSDVIVNTAIKREDKSSDKYYKIF